MIPAERKRWDERIARIARERAAELAVEVNEITSTDGAEVNTKPKRSRKKKTA